MPHVAFYVEGILEPMDAQSMRWGLGQLSFISQTRDELSNSSNALVQKV